MMNHSNDTEELEDFIRLDFADLQASENLQLLDPGIIDLECDSDECTSIKEKESFHGQPDPHSQSVTTSNSNIIDLKPICIKVVDCYKFPWYFDKFKDIIEHKLATKENVKVDYGILDDSSTDANPAKEIVDTHCVDMSVVDSVTMQRQANDCRKEVAELNKEIDAIPAKEIENKKPITGAKCVKNNVKNNKMDFDIRRAMEQRKNSVVDLKRNVGLVGMKILRLPNKIPSKLPIDISISKRLKKPIKANTEKGQGNTQEKGPTSSSHVQAFTNVTSTTPVFEGMKDGETTQNITEKLRQEPFIRLLSALVETETKSTGTPLDRRCNLENEFSLDLSVNKIAEEIYRLVRPHKYAGNINQTIVPNSCNTMTTPTKVTEEKNIKRSKYYSETFQKYIAQGARRSKMIDPIPISLKKRNKARMKSHLQSKASEIIDLSDEMSPKSSSTEANIISNKTPENIKDHKAKEMGSKNKPSSFIVKPKIVLSTKKPNKLTETIIKIKEKQRKESSFSEPTKSQKQSSNTTPTSTLLLLSENRSLPKEITNDVIIPDYKNISTQEQLFNENFESKNIKSSCPKISSNRNDFENSPSRGNHSQNTTKNNVSTDSNILVKPAEKEAEKVSENNCLESAQITTESSMTVNREESNTLKNKSVTEKIIVKVKLIDSTKEKLKQHHDTHQFPAVNPIETATNNFASRNIASNRETIISCTKFDTVSNHNSNTAVIVNTTTQNNESPVMAEPLTVYNSKPPESSYQNFRQSQCNALRVPLHKPLMNQPIDNYTGHPSLNSTQHPKEVLPHIDARPPPSGVNEKILPQMSHKLPMPILQSKNFGALMPNGIKPNMQTRMRHPGPNGGFGAQMASNPRPMSPFVVSSQMSEPQETVSSQKPQIPIDEMQSYNILWSAPFSCIPLPPPPPPPPYLSASQDISKSSPESLPQSMDSSIIGRNINGIVKKINITAPVKEEIDSKAGIIKIENLEMDASTPLYDEPTDYFKNIEPVNTKQEMLRILDTGLQRVFSRIDVLTTAKEIQNQVIQHSSINGRPNSKKENLLSQGKLGKSPKENTHEKCDSGTRKINNAVQNLINVERAPTKEHQNYKSKSQHKSNHYLMNFIRKSKENKDKRKEKPSKTSNDSHRNRVENYTDLIVHESGNLKISAKQSSCIPEQTKHNEITKKPISNDLKFIQDSKKGHKSKKLSDNISKLTFEDLFGNDVDDAGYEKVATDQKSIGKRHSSLGNTEKTSMKSYESSINLKRPANDEKPALSPKYRPGPLSKKKKLNDQDRVNPHQVNKKQILQSKTYSDPILPIPTYEKILSNMPSYLCFRDDNIKNSSLTEHSRYKKTSGSVNPKIPDPEKKIIEKEKERQKHDKAENIKKISLYEYKKRSGFEMHRRPSHADSDLGYDSDSTVKL